MPLPLHRSAHPEALRIIQAYPEVFGHPPLHPSHSTLTHGFLCGPGWHQILEELAGQLKQVVREDGLEKFAVWHVSERSGVLTIRHRYGNHRIKSLITAAGVKSQMICEDCATPSRRQVRDKWGSTLCDACYGSYLREVTAALADQRGRPLRLSSLADSGITLAIKVLGFRRDMGIP